MAGVTLIVAAVIAVGSAIYVASQKPEDHDNGTNLTKKGSQNSRNKVYGKCRVSCTNVYTNVLNRDQSWRMDVFSVAGVGPVYFHNVWIKEKKMFPADKNEMTNPLSGVSGMYGDHAMNPSFQKSKGFTIQWRSGQEDQVAANLAIANSDGEWTSLHRGAFVPHIVIFADFSDDTEYPIIGDQYKIEALVTAVELFDPRTGNVDGDSSNPALALYDFLTNDYYGMGIPADYIDTSSFISAANLCEANGLEINAEIDASAPYSSTLYNMVSIFGGALVIQNGYIKVLFEKEESVALYSIGLDDIVFNSFSANPGNSRDYYNVVSASFRSVDNDYRTDDYVIPSDALDQLSPTYNSDGTPTRISIDGELITKDIELNFVSESKTNNYGAVEWNCRREYARSNFTKSCIFDLDLLAFPDLEVWSVIEITHPIYGWVNKKFRVMSIVNSLSDERYNIATVRCVEYDDSIYNNTFSGNAGDGRDWEEDVLEPTGLTFSLDSFVSDGYGTLSWTAQHFTLSTTYDIEYKLSSESSWTRVASAHPLTNYKIYALKVGDYDFRVRTYDNILGVSDWTTITNQTIDINYILPIIQNLSIDATTSSFVLNWDDALDYPIGNGTNSSDPNSGGATGTVRDVFDHYYVTIYKDGVSQSTHKVTDTSFYYTFEMNSASPAGADRNISATVEISDASGNRNAVSDPTMVSAKNPQISSPNGATTYNSNGDARLSWDPRSEPDFSGTLIHVSETPNFTPNESTLITNLGIDTTYTYKWPVNDSETRYCRIAHYDKFGTDEISYSNELILEYVGGAQSAQAISVNATSQIFRQSSDGGTITPDSITIDANRQNIANPVVWTTNPAITYTTVDEDTITISSSDFGSNDSVQITATAGAFSDYMTIVKIKDGGSNGEDGSDALYVVLSNESHTIPTAADGSNGDYSNSGTKISVYEGNTQLTYDGVGTSASKFRTSAIGTEITPGAVTTSGNSALYGNSSNLTADSAIITFTIIGKRIDGSAFSFEIIQSISRSKAGDDGVTAAGFYSYEHADISADGDALTQAEIDSLFTTASGGKPIEQGDMLMLTLAPTGGYRRESGVWVSVENVIDGSMIVNGSIGAKQINVNDLFAEDITASGSISGAKLSVTNNDKSVVLDPGNISPLRVSNGSTDVLGFDAQGRLFIDAGIGVNSILDKSAFSPELWDQIKTPLTEGATGGSYDGIDISSKTSLTSLIKIPNCNARPVYVAVRFNGSGVGDSTNPVWNLTIRERHRSENGSWTQFSTLVNQEQYVGGSNYDAESDIHEAYINVNYQRSFNISGLSVNGEVEVEITFVKTQGSITVNMLAPNISQTIEGGGAQGAASTLNGEPGSFYLDYSNFTNIPETYTPDNLITVYSTEGKGLDFGNVGKLYIWQPSNDLWLRNHGTGQALGIKGSGTGLVFYDGAENKVFHQGFTPSKSDVGLGNVPNESFETYGLKTSKSLSGNDLNTIMSSGFYRLSNNHANLAPNTGWGQMIVSRGSDTVLQIASDYNSQHLLFRSSSGASSSSAPFSSSWSRIYHENHKPTWDEIENKPTFADYVRTGYKSLGVGWYTIARVGSGRASAKFVIAEQTSGLHQAVHFYAGNHFANGSVINVLSNSTYSGGGAFRFIRIMAKGTYDGAYLQVYIDNGNAAGVIASMQERLQSGNGWELVEWENTTIPSGFVTKCSIDLDKSLGINTTHKVVATGDIETESTLRGSRVSVAGNDFYSDSGGRIRTDSEFFVNASGNVYLYGSKIFLGSTGGQTIDFRSNNVTASNWSVNANGDLIARTIESNYNVDGAYLGVKQTAGTGAGVSLYGAATSGAPSYGLMFAKTSNFGTFGAVNQDWATYFTSSGSNGRGWIFRHAGNNVASISGTGSAFVRCVDAGTSLNINNSLACSNWFRSTGTSGWYNQTYEGGIYMTNNEFVRVYNNKKFQVDSTASDSITTSGGVTSVSGFNTGMIRVDQGKGLNVNAAASSSWARGIFVNNSSSSTLAGAGFLGGTNSVSRYAVGFNSSWWSNYVFAVLTTGVDVKGTITATGIIKGADATATSDLRLKSEFEPITNALDKIDLLFGQTYIHELMDGRKAGLIAQDVERVLPEAVMMDENGIKQVSPWGVIALLTNALKELKAEVRGIQNGD